MKIDKSERSWVALAANRYASDFQNRFYPFLQAVHLPHSPPTEVAEYEKRAAELIAALNVMSSEGGELDDSFAPLLREAVIYERLQAATRVEEQRRHVLGAELLSELDRELLPSTSVMAKPWFQGATPARVPRPADYFPIEDIEKEVAKARTNESAESRTYDEKFHILQAPPLFLRDLHAARASSQVRGVSVAVAYIDIDDFKSFNTEYREPFVDRNVLPPFMRKLEAHVYMRGHAYRFGGDEYVVVLFNTSPEEALDSIDRLRKGVADLKYVGLSRSLTVSVGLVIVAPSCHLTGPELEERAARAKNFAKDQGKNRIATYEDPWFEKMVVARG